MTTPTIVISNISTERNLEPSGRSGSCPLIRGNSASFRAPQQITVMLQGLVFNAVVSVDVWTAEISEIKQPGAELPDSNYTIMADLSEFKDCRSLTLNAVSVGNNISITLTLAGQSATQIFREKLDFSLDTLPNFSYNKSTDGVLAEKRQAWVTHSTRNLASKRAKKSLYGSAGCMVIPSNTVLNLRALVGAFDRLSVQQIEQGIQELIDLLDYRNSDSDLEVDADFEPEIEEKSSQLI